MSAPALRALLAKVKALALSAHPLEEDDETFVRVAFILGQIAGLCAAAEADE